MANHPPASRQNTMKGTGLPAIRSAAAAPAESKVEAEKEFQLEGKNEMEAALERAREADKLGEVMDYAPYATDQSTSGIWGAKAVAERQFRFSRWYFRAEANAVVDLFMTQAAYDEADVEARRALAHKHGTRYAALGPEHSRRPEVPQPNASKEQRAVVLARRAKYPSLVEQLAQKVG